MDIVFRKYTARVRTGLLFPPRVFPVARDPSGRAVVRFSAVLAGAGAGGALRKKLVVVPAKKSPPLGATLVGLADGDETTSLAGEAALPPGRFEAFLADFPGLKRRFDIAEAPDSAVRIYCPHPGKTSSHADVLSAFAADGGALVSSWVYATRGCCWKRKTAAPLPLAGRALCYLEALSRPLSLESDAGRVSLKPGEAVVADLRGLVRLETAGHPPPHYRQVMVSPRGLADFLRSSGLDGLVPEGNGFLCRPAPVTPGMGDAVLGLERALGRPGLLGADFHVRLAVDRFLLALARDLPTRLKSAWERRPASRFPDPRLEKAVRYLERHYARTYDRNALARAAGASRQLLASLFQKHLHQTAIRYLQGVRIARAQALLAQKEMGISKVAAAVGYRDFRTFKRLFRRLSENPLPPRRG